MEKVKCECGHINPHGTILCEACGKILDEKMNQNDLLDMRYEGSARRSKRITKRLLIKCGIFFHQ